MKWFCRHDWSVWYNLEGASVDNRKQLAQSRRCKKCKRLRVRIIKPEETLK